MNKKGFTLVETLIAVSILVISIAIPMGVIAESILRTGITNEKLTAQLLAQEGIEIVRQIRDTNVIKRTDWLDRLGQCKTNTNGCDFNDSRLVGVVPVGEEHYELFKRQVKIIESSRGPTSAIVSVTVTWDGIDEDESVEIREILYKWLD